MIARKFSIRSRIDRLLSLWFAFSMRHAWAVIILSIASAAGALYYTINNLRINTYPGNVLSDKLPWRQDKLAFEKAFPQFKDSIVIVLDGKTQDQARDAARQIYGKLKNNAQIEWIFYPPEDPYFRENGLLYEDTAAIEDLSNRLATMQPFISEVANDPGLRGMFSLFSRAIKEGKTDELDFSSIYGNIATVLRGYLDGTGQPLSWTEVMAGKQSKPSEKRVIMEVMPKIEYSTLTPGEELIASIRQSGKDLHLAENGVLMRISGSAALSVDELKSASVGAQMASLGSFLGVSLVMLVGLRSLWLVLAVQIGLVLGLIFTAAFAALSLGQLNLISVAFSVMYIGIGADYAIYLCLRYRELTSHSADHRSALKRAVRHVGGSLEIGTLTTAIGFFCFVPTSYRGVAELGIISGAGMFISLIVTLAILPAFLGLKRPCRYRGSHLEHPAPPFWLKGILTFPVQHSKGVLVTALLAAILAILQLRHASFDSNPLDLQDPTAESVQTFRELLSDASNSPWSLVALTKSDKESAELKQQLQKLPTVDKVLSMADFVPEEQDEKLNLIDQLSLTLGPQLQSGNPKPAAANEESAAALRNFLATLSTYLASHPEASDSKAAFDLEVELARVTARVESLKGDEKARALDQLNHLFTGSLQSQLSHLQDVLKARRVNQTDLPLDFRDRWLSAEGLQRIEIRPREDLHNPEAMQRFVEEVRNVAPHATGTPVLFLESSNAVVKAFTQAFTYAIIAITVVLFFTMEKKIDVLLVLTPLLLASLLTGALMAIMGVHFNFANIIALPLVFGMGVDNCIHLVHRYRTAPPSDGILLHSSTALAVLLSALTNISGFGNLSVSPHQGMASMGIMLTIGILATLFCSMIVLPALLAQLEKLNGRSSVQP